MTEAATLVAAIAKAEALYGPADLLVNNAGVMLLGQIDTQEANEWKRMFDVNVLGLLNGMHAVLADMKDRNYGTIVNISSIAGKLSRIMLLTVELSLRYMRFLKTCVRKWLRAMYV